MAVLAQLRMRLIDDTATLPAFSGGVEMLVIIKDAGTAVCPAATDPGRAGTTLMAVRAEAEEATAKRNEQARTATRAARKGMRLAGRRSVIWQPGCSTTRP